MSPAYNETIPLIQSVKPLPHKRLQLVFSTGSVLELNIENRLNAMRYYPLRDEEVFRSVTTDGFYLHFCGKDRSGIDLDLRETILLAINPPPNTFTGFNPFHEKGDAT